MFVTKLDPTGQSLIYSSYLGGVGTDRGGAIAVDSNGNLYITGSTTSADFPIVNAFQSTFGGGSSDAFLTKLSPSGTLIYSTYVGGDGPLYLPGNYYELGTAIAVDAIGNAYLAGQTDSNNFPLLQPIKSTLEGNNDAFLLKMSPGGSLLFSTYLGGNSDDSPAGLTTDAAGNLYLAGSTYSTNFPIVNATSFLVPNADQYSGFVMKVTGDGATILNSTLIGGSSYDDASSIAVDGSQNVYLGGFTSSRDFPVANALQPENPTTAGAGDRTGWVAKIQSDFATLNYSTYLGGNDYGSVQSVCVDSSNNLYAAGSTSANNFPLVDPIYTSTGVGGGTLSRFSPDGTTLTFSTYLGGAGPSGMVLSANGDIYLTGSTNSTSFPLVNPYQQFLNGLSSHQTFKADAFVMKLSAQNELTISGQVTDGYGNGMGGITVNLTGTLTKSGVTFANGRYLFNVTPGGNYSVQAVQAPFTFTPASQSFNSLSANQVANFSIVTRNLSGRITDADGNGVPDATVGLTGSYATSVQSAADGNYSIIAPLGGTYTLTPSKSGLLAVYVFTPATRTISNLSADTTGLNFTSSITFTESFYPIADAYVEDGTSASLNFGTAALLKIQTKNGSNRDSYFKFDTSGLSRKVVSAKLRFYAATSATGSIATSAYGVLNSTWIESGTGGITWNTAPPRNSTAITSATVTVTGTAYAYYEIDITSYVISEIAAGRSLMSLALHNGSTSTPFISLNSRESATKPELQITTADDNRPPVVSLTNPTNGAQFTTPATVTVSATATDNDGPVAKVEFYAGTNLIGTATSAPYTVAWNNVSAGNYSLVAVATDNNGASGSSTPAAITVNNPNSPPQVYVTAPVAATTFPSGTSITLSATALDLDGTVTKVDFLAGSTIVGTATAPVNGSYSVIWSNVGAGAYVLTAKATDNSNATTTSTPANIDVVAITGLSPTADAYVRDGSSATSNFGTATTLQTQSSNTSGNNRESYLKFDLTTVTGISKAKLRLYGGLSDTTSSNVPAAIFSVATTTWVESGSGSITWNTKPAAGATALATSVIIDNTSRWYEWDVTPYLQSEKAAGRNVVSLVVKNTTQSTAFASFNSREAATNQPQLILWSTQPPNALLVVGSTTLNTGDTAAKSRLQNLGYTVTVKAAGSNQNTAIKTSDADGKTLVVISSTVTPANVTNKFRNVAVPVLLWEFDILDDMGMTGLVSGTDFGTSSTTQTQLAISNAAHPMAAGLTGTATVATSATNFTWGKPNANAVKIATLTNDSTKFVVFGYDAQATMPGLEAPARRVGLFLTDTTAASLNSNGGALFDAAVKWVTEIVTGPVISAITPSFGPTGTAVVVSGLNFGASQGQSTLTFNGVSATPTSWSDRSITASVPLYSSTGPLVVTVNLIASNAITFVVGDSDVDADGLPDWWEIQYFGNLNQTASGDPDGDGLTNLQEYQQGRNPTKIALPDSNGAVNLKVYTPLSSPTP